MLEIDAEGADSRLSVIQEVQRNPITNQILHLDLYEVSADETMEVNVNVHTVGTAYGVRNEDGVIGDCLPRTAHPLSAGESPRVHPGGRHGPARQPDPARQ